VTDPLLIRRAGPADAAIITRFNLHLAAETEDLRLDPACVAAGVAAVLADAAKGVYFLAELGGAVAGQTMITYEWSDWRNGLIWWLQSVYVSPEFRRQGVFRALFDHLLGEAARQPQVCALRLYMHRDNVAARRTYERAGMVQTHYEVFEYDNPHPLPPTPAAE